MLRTFSVTIVLGTVDTSRLYSNTRDATHLYNRQHQLGGSGRTREILTRHAQRDTPRLSLLERDPRNTRGCIADFEAMTDCPVAGRCRSRGRPACQARRRTSPRVRRALYRQGRAWRTSATAATSGQQQWRGGVPQAARDMSRQLE